MKEKIKESLYSIIIDLYGSSEFIPDESEWEISPCDAKPNPDTGDSFRQSLADVPKHI